jgi:hypothetical protein
MSKLKTFDKHLEEKYGKKELNKEMNLNQNQSLLWLVNY